MLTMLRSLDAKILILMLRSLDAKIFICHFYISEMYFWRFLVLWSFTLNKSKRILFETCVKRASLCKGKLTIKCCNGLFTRYQQHRRQAPFMAVKTSFSISSGTGPVVLSLLPSPFPVVLSLLPSPFPVVLSLLPSPFPVVLSLLPSPFPVVLSLLPSPIFPYLISHPTPRHRGGQSYIHGDPVKKHYDCPLHKTVHPCLLKLLSKFCEL